MPDGMAWVSQVRGPEDHPGDQSGSRQTVRLRAVASDGGHGIFPTGGHRFSPAAAMRSPH